MIKRTLVLSMAAYGSAQAQSTSSLRGVEGVEMVSEGLEHFPPAHYGVGFDRRLIGEQQQQLEEDDEDEWVVTSEIIDNDEGHAILDEEDWEMAWAAANEEEVEDVEIDFEAAQAAKAYARDPKNTVLVGTDVDLLGEAVDQYDRRESACDENKSEFKIMLRTDNYGYETKWSLHNTADNSKLASGPPVNKNYADKSLFAGRWCLPPGRYSFKIRDTGGDGICKANFGCGFLKLFMNGQSAGQVVNDSSDWTVKNFPFTVAPGSSRIDGTNTGNNNAGWCQKVRGLMQKDQGTCNNGSGHRVRVTVKTDQWGEETSFKIKQNGVVKMEMGNVVPGNSKEVVEKCLPAGKYVFKIEDFDGLCCKHGNGFYDIEVNGKKLIKGASFSTSEEHTIQLGYDWISTMNERDCEWWYAHDYRRRDWHVRCYSGQYCNKSYRHLKWSTSLKAAANTYAQSLLSSCDSNGILHDATDQGENLAKNKGRGDWGQLYATDLVTKRFVDNEEFWGWNKNAHLTQAMWYPTRYMGCAESVKDMGDGKMCRMQVCRYAKAGNCMMNSFNSATGNNWMKAMMQDDSPCGPMCTPTEGCYH